MEANVWASLLKLLEKTVATYVQVFIGLLLMSEYSDVIRIDAGKAAAIAAIPAALTVVANGLPAVPIGLAFVPDLVFRTIRTYVASFLGLLLAVPVFNLSVDALQAAMLGAVPAALAVVKGLVATHFGSPDTAALLPADVDVAA